MMETRYCACGCGEALEPFASVKNKFVSGHGSFKPQSRTDHDESTDEELIAEFTGYLNSYIFQGWGKLALNYDPFHDHDDLKQSAYLALLQSRADFNGVRDPYERLVIAKRAIARGTGLEKRLTQAYKADRQGYQIVRELEIGGYSSLELSQIEKVRRRTTQGHLKNEH